jgi:hypothetical protein
LSDGAAVGPSVIVAVLWMIQVTSCLLGLNGDHPAFSIARVAQAIRTTTALLETVITGDGAWQHTCRHDHMIWHVTNK